MMTITEVGIELVANPKNERLLAFGSMVIDGCFVVRDLKIINGSHGPFVDMPSRRIMRGCHNCGERNHLLAKFCNDCGYRLKTDFPIPHYHGRPKPYAEIAHPINSDCRKLITDEIVSAYYQEIELAQQSRHPHLFQEVATNNASPDVAS